MRNLFIPSGTLEFIGSKERLQKTVTRSNGKLLPEQKFELTLSTWRNRPIGPNFCFQSSYTQTNQGFEIVYRILPTTATLISYIVVIVLFFTALIASFASPEASKSSPLIIFILPLLFWGHRSNCKHCEKVFRNLFSAITGSRKER